MIGKFLKKITENTQKKRDMLQFQFIAFLGWTLIMAILYAAVSLNQYTPLNVVSAIGHILAALMVVTFIYHVSVIKKYS